MRTFLSLLLASALSTSVACASVVYPGTAPAEAQSSLKSYKDNWTGTLNNKLFTASYQGGSKGVSLTSLKTAGGEELLNADSLPIFTIRMIDGKVYTPANMKCLSVNSETLTPDESAVKLSSKLPGKALTATFSAPDASFQVQWKAVLRDGSHYLRQELNITAARESYISTITALQCHVTGGTTPTISGNTTHGRIVMNNKVFAGLETPMSIMTAGSQGKVETPWNPGAWMPESFADAFSIPASFEKQYGKTYSDKHGPAMAYLRTAEGPVRFEKGGDCNITFQYKSGTHRLNILGVQLLDDADAVVSEDVHKGSTGHTGNANTYHITVPAAGEYKLRYWVETRTESITSAGNIELSLPLAKEESVIDNTPERLVKGIWERKAPLQAGDSWKVSSVLGLVAPGQQRRSFLAYSERERAVPYRPFIHYNDWYEIGITINNNPDPLKRNSEHWQLKTISTWYRELYKKRNTTIDAFVIDDGWDDFNSLWGFHAGFPNGFELYNVLAGTMKAGIGTWLGPVGGYGQAKSLRLGFWNRNHPDNQIGNFQLSNKEYFDAFIGRCSQMVRDYDMRYFKFDGISDKFHAKGPGNTEDAEGIIRVLTALRQARPDIYLNTTVGTWASPFWVQFSDATWRQENDFGQEGNVGDARDKWMTYRDRLVHEVYVTGAPFCPLNSIMTHGLIITKNGPPRVMSKDPANCIKEMRTAFGFGSSLQELYVDQDLMGQKDGMLWDELAKCIQWIRSNKDVLADIHWVGGNPWDRTRMDGDIYGWAAWNPAKCVLTLRNSSGKARTLTTTLREVLDVPPSVKGAVILRNSFSDQRPLPGITDTVVDVDTPVCFTLKPMEVFVWEGSPAN